MTRRLDILESVIRHGMCSPIVFSTGFTCRDAFTVKDAPNHLYMTGSMGMAPLVGLGIARQTKRTTIVVDGDGAILMNPAAMMVVRQYRPDNYLHLVLDNGTYESTGGQPTSSAMFDICGIAMIIGYRQATVIANLRELHASLPQLIAEPTGPHLVHIHIDNGDRSAPRITIDPLTNYHRFRDWLTSSIPIHEAGKR